MINSVFQLLNHESILYVFAWWLPTINRTSRPKRHQDGHHDSLPRLHNNYYHEEEDEEERAPKKFNDVIHLDVDANNENGQDNKGAGNDDQSLRRNSSYTKETSNLHATTYIVDNANNSSILAEEGTDKKPLKNINSNIKRINSNSNSDPDAYSDFDTLYHNTEENFEYSNVDVDDKQFAQTLFKSLSKVQ